ncbi:ABC transporter ATP-binding protein [Lactobacillus sp. CBA3605]|uniref:ATP-binding cassette domain-containing protein n=1 Tax=Lactobacillus sp. CBA3605 TaxID=2099788 RepID=UPI000CFD9699|nr:ATP-binding cassette domain-containing protein [Lactobacillus sp. CBA3605]AVK61660.1 ABC transporter ATP-binding protein [Lactobacillus sp. CBA3605]
MVSLKLSKIEKQINGQTLFEIDQLQATGSAHIGVVGRNGAGKSTLAHLITGADQDYTGQVLVDAPVSYVPQIAANHDRSGGQAMLARVRQALQERPEILILDEPSSNLDETHQAWLIKKLQQYRGLLVLISHDRQLLNAVTDQTWAVAQHQFTAYAGNYAAYAAVQAQQLASQQNAYDRQTRHTQELQQAMQARREKAQRVRRGNRRLTPAERANSKSLREATAAKLERSASSLGQRGAREATVAKPVTATGFKLVATDFPPLTGKTVVAATDFTLRAFNQTILNQLNLQLKPGERVALVGPNGCGKTTLLQAIQARTAGLAVAPTAKIGVFNQDMTLLDGQLTVWKTVRATSALPDQTIRNVLGALGLPARFYSQLVASLSGGELVKLQLARILVGMYNVLILDEPTNYLDVAALDALAAYLQHYPGTVLFVSHDATFRQQVVTRTLTFADRTLIDPAQVATQAAQPSDLPLLQFKYDQLMQDPTAKTADIQALRMQIEALK